MKTKNEQKLLKEPVQNNHNKNIGTLSLKKSNLIAINYKLNPSGFQAFIKIKIVYCTKRLILLKVAIECVRTFMLP